MILGLMGVSRCQKIKEEIKLTKFFKGVILDVAVIDGVNLWTSAVAL